MITEAEIRAIAERHVISAINAPDSTKGKFILENMIREAIMKERQSNQENLCRLSGINLVGYNDLLANKQNEVAS